MMKNPDPIYGDGFREVKQIFETEGGRNLEKTIQILQAKAKRSRKILSQIWSRSGDGVCCDADRVFVQSKS